MNATADNPKASRARYGLDAPGVVMNLLVLAAVCALGWVALRGTRWWWPAYWLAATSVTFLLTSGAMVYMSFVGKLRMRDRLLGLVEWRGDERVLDVGCGRGLMLIGAARRVPRGTAVGVDVWSASDLSGNSAGATVANARAEGVAARVRVVGADARRLPMSDETFDAVVSTTVLHNIPDATGRAAAVREIARVLRPGGRAVVSDIRHLSEYARTFREAGLTATVVRRGLSAAVVPLATMGSLRPGHVVAVKG